MFINTTEKRIFLKKEQIDVFDSFGHFQIRNCIYLSEKVSNNVYGLNRLRCVTEIHFTGMCIVMLLDTGISQW